MNHISSIHDGEKKPVAKKPNPYVWLLWWQMDPDELDKQIQGYSTLKFTQSARGISAILLLISVAATALFVFLLGMTPYAFLDAAAFLVLALFISKGHRWPMIAAMILWTFEKGISLYDQFQAAAAGSSGASFLLTTVIWWTMYMHAFYLAFRVEQARRKV